LQYSPVNGNDRGEKAGYTKVKAVGRRRRTRMAGVKEIRRPDVTFMDTVPSDEEFVAAVIRVHERILSNLGALARGYAWARVPLDSREGAVIQAYSAAHGGPRPAAPRVSEAYRR
jgi:hypothetical protein